MAYLSPRLSPDAAEVKRLAKDKLGAWRQTLRGELKAVPDVLAPGERILTVAVATSGMKGRLLVVTERGLLFIAKTPLRPVRCTRYRFGEIDSLQAVEKPMAGSGNFRLEFTRGGEREWWQINPPIRASEVAGIAGLATARGSLLLEPATPLG